MNNTLSLLILLLSTLVLADNKPVSNSSGIVDPIQRLEVLEITATVGDQVEVLASHTIYKVLSEGKKRRVRECSSSPNHPCLEDFIPGNYIIKTVIKDFRKETLIEIKPGGINKISIPIGQTGKVEINASETEQEQNSAAFHKILKREYDGAYTNKISCSSSLEKSCLQELPLGEYLLKSVNSQSKKTTSFKIIEGKTTKIHIIFSSAE